MLNHPTSPERDRADRTRVTRYVRTIALMSILTALLVILAVQPALAVVPTIENAGFEDWSSGKPDHWTVLPGVASATSPSHGTPGARAVLLQDANANSSSMNSTITAGDTADYGHPVEQNRTYRLAAWAKSDRGSAAPALVMWFTDLSGNMIGSKYIVRGSDFGVNQTTWKQMSSVRQAPVGAEHVVVQLGMYGGTGLGVTFDDVELDEVSTSAGVDDMFSGWSVWRSVNLGSGVSVNPVTGGLFTFTGTGDLEYELNGNATVSRSFGRPIDTLSFRLTTAGGWKDSGKLVLSTWRYNSVGGKPSTPVDLLVDASGTSAVVDFSRSGLDTKRIDFTCDAERVEADKDMSATITDVKAFSPVWRFHNLKNGYYLWTADEAERNNILAKLGQTWFYEGPSYNTDLLNPACQSPLWRFRNLKGGYYLYTSDVNEKNSIVANLSTKWKLEGESYNVSRDPSGAPVWRFRNNFNGSYLYSADATEKTNIVNDPAHVWTLEGEAYYLTR